MNEVFWHKQSVTRAERHALNKHAGATIWLTGLSGSGKSTIANAASRALFEQGIATYVLDADNLRLGLNSDLGFSDSDRVENVRRIGEVAALVADAGIVAFVPVISPFSEGREQVRDLHKKQALGFAEIYVAAPVSDCMKRDPKGLYARQRAGLLSGLTGVDAPYEAPVNAELILQTDVETPDECVKKIVASLSHLWQFSPEVEVH